MNRQMFKDEMMMILRARAECCRKLIELSEEQQNILMEGKHTELADNISKFDPLLLEFHRFEKHEESIAQHIDSNLKEALENDLEYRELESQVSSSAERLHKLTESNKQLLANAMDFINFSIGAICKLADSTSTGESKNNPAIVMDMRV